MLVIVKGDDCMMEQHTLRQQLTGCEVLANAQIQIILFQHTDQLVISADTWSSFQVLALLERSTRPHGTILHSFELNRAALIQIAYLMSKYRTQDMNGAPGNLQCERVKKKGMELKNI